MTTRESRTTESRALRLLVRVHTRIARLKDQIRELEAARAEAWEAVKVAQARGCGRSYAECEANNRAWDKASKKHNACEAAENAAYDRFFRLLHTQHVIEQFAKPKS